jgi:hypothetical protein
MYPSDILEGHVNALRDALWRYPGSVLGHSPGGRTQATAYGNQTAPDTRQWLDLHSGVIFRISP